MPPTNKDNVDLTSNGKSAHDDKASECPELSLTPKLRIHLEDLSHSSIRPFTTLIDMQTVLPNAVNNVLRHLYKPYGKPQAVRSITMILENMGGVAYTTGLAIDDLHKEIHVSLDYIGMKKDPTAFRDECIGVITHEMVHCWQHDACGTAPGGLIEGIADYVRLKSGLAPPHWQKTRDEIGNNWDEGYQKTAWFLEWLEDQKGVGLVSRINDALEGRVYDEKVFWKELCGDSVESLWKGYLKHWDDDTNESSSSTATTEPEVIDLNEEEKAAAEEQQLLKAQPFQA